MFLLITLFGCFAVWYFLAWKHPKNFPPGPRLHLPLLGDSLSMLINGDVYQSMRQLSDKYGDYCGFWLGKYRAVTIKDFDGMQSLLWQTSTTGRKKTAAKCKFICAILIHTIRKVKFLSINSFLTQPQHFYEFFIKFFFDNFSRESKVVNS